MECSLSLDLPPPKLLPSNRAAMEKITKKEIRQIAEEAARNTLAKVKITTPAKKTSKKLPKISKKLSQVLKEEVKRERKASKSVEVKARRKISRQQRLRIKNKTFMN